MRNDLAAVDAGAGADVDDMIGGQDRVLVVFDDDHGVADVSQVFERVEQPRVVALMQPDRRLVEHVKHARQPGADLRGEADALAFAAGERAGGPRQRQVLQADVIQEFQPVANFLQDARCDFGLLLREGLRNFLEPDVRSLDREITHFADVLAADFHGERLRLQAIAAAGFARVRSLIARQLFAHPVRVRFLEAAFDVADDALERLLGRIVARAVPVGEDDVFITRAVEDRELHVLRQPLPRRLHRNLVVLGETFERLLVVGGRDAGLRPGIDGALLEAER